MFKRMFVEGRSATARVNHMELAGDVLMYLDSNTKCSSVFAHMAGRLQLSNLEEG